MTMANMLRKQRKEREAAVGPDLNRPNEQLTPEQLIEKNRRLMDLYGDDPHKSEKYQLGEVTGAMGPAVAREQYDYYQDTFVPVERGLTGQIRTPEEIGQISRNTGISARKNAADAEAEYGRNLGRFGIGLSPAQQSESNQMFQMGGVGAEAGATTRTRSGLYDLNLQNMGDFVGLGRGIAVQSQDALSDASQLQTQTRNANRQIDAQNDASRNQAIVMTAVMVF